MAEAFGVLGGAVGILDIVINRFEKVADRVEAARTLGADARTILAICKQVRGLADKHAWFSFEDSITKRIAESLKYVEDVTKQYDDNDFPRRIIRPIKALYRVKKLDEIEQKLNTVLNLINAAVNSDTNENTTTILRKQESSLVAMIQEIQKLSTMRDPGAEHAGEDPDEWIADFVSVPNLSFQHADTANVRALKMALLGDPPLHSVITAYGMGGAGKTTACKMVARDDEVVSRFKDGILWLELGEKSTSAELIKRLASVVKKSGGKSIARAIRIANNANLADVEADFQKWFWGRAVLFVVDNIWETSEKAFNDWIGQVRLTAGREGAVLFSSRTPLGDKDIEFAQLGPEDATELLKTQQKGLRVMSNQRKLSLNVALACPLP
jgi:hypothetical protein